MLTLGSLTTLTSCFVFCFCSEKWKKRRQRRRFDKSGQYQRVDSVSSMVDSHVDPQEHQEQMDSVTIIWREGTPLRSGSEQMELFHTSQNLRWWRLFDRTPFCDVREGWSRAPVLDHVCGQCAITRSLKICYIWRSRLGEMRNFEPFLVYRGTRQAVLKFPAVGKLYEGMLSDEDFLICKRTKKWPCKDTDIHLRHSPVWRKKCIKKWQMLAESNKSFTLIMQGYGFNWNIDDP